MAILWTFSPTSFHQQHFAYHVPLPLDNSQAYKSNIVVKVNHHVIGIWGPISSHNAHTQCHKWWVHKEEAAHSDRKNLISRITHFTWVHDSRCIVEVPQMTIEVLSRLLAIEELHLVYTYRSAKFEHGYANITDTVHDMVSSLLSLLKSVFCHKLAMSLPSCFLFISMHRPKAIGLDMTSQPRLCTHCRWPMIEPVGRAFCLLCVSHFARNTCRKVFISKSPVASGLFEILTLSHLSLSLPLSISLAVTTYLIFFSFYL